MFYYSKEEFVIAPTQTNGKSDILISIPAQNILVLFSCFKDLETMKYC